MRILQVIPGLDARSGGPVSATVGLALALARQGDDVRVLSSFAEGQRDASIVDRLRSAGVLVREVGPVSGPLSRHADLRGAIEEMVREADVLHLNGVWEEIQHLGAAAAPRCGVPYVVSPHGMLTQWALSNRRWKKRAYLWWRLRRDLENASLLHFTSRMEARSTSKLSLRAPSIVQPLGVDSQQFESLPSRGALRARHPEIGSRTMVLFLGRIHPVKGLDLLIEAFAKAKTDDAVLVIAGPDAEGFRAKLESLAQRLGVARSIVWTAMLDEHRRAEALADADLFVLPSHHENFGLVVIEALAAGCPVIVSDRVGLCDEVQEAQVGITVPLAVEPLAEQLKSWLRDGSVRARFAAGARAFVRERYAWPRIAEQWIGHYQGLLKAKGAQPSEPPAHAADRR